MAQIGVYPKMLESKIFKNLTFVEGSKYSEIFTKGEHKLDKNGYLIGWYFVRANENNCSMGINKYINI